MINHILDFEYINVVSIIKYDIPKYIPAARYRPSNFNEFNQVANNPSAEHLTPLTNLDDKVIIQLNNTLYINHKKCFRKTDNLLGILLEKLQNLPLFNDTILSTNYLKSLGFVIIQPITEDKYHICIVHDNKIIFTYAEAVLIGKND